MERWAIYDVCRRWKDSVDRRPWIVIEVIDEQTARCFPISTKNYGESCFELRSDRPEFPNTGLTQTCHVHDERLYEIGVDELLRKRGALIGDLLDEFRGYSGI